MKLLFDFFSIDAQVVTKNEKLASSLGAFIGILVVSLVANQFLVSEQAIYITASMGASAVLLFAVPHGALSQPWAVIGGHLVSAIVGVTVAKFVPNLFVSSALSVGLAVMVMHYLRCIHPPGGATALIAVIGGGEIHTLGYGFVLFPVALNAIIIVLVAVIFNAVFAWRTYPVGFAKRHQEASNKAENKSADILITHKDLEYAFGKMDLLIDIAEEDLLTIYRLAVENSRAAIA